MTDASTPPNTSRDDVSGRHGDPIEPGQGSGAPATDDPYVEGDAATTDEWFGQSVERDTELAERLVEQHGGDLAAAEADFAQQSTGAKEQEARRHGPAPTNDGASDCASASDH